jgi:hypothetical protein
MAQRSGGSVEGGRCTPQVWQMKASTSTSTSAGN